MTEPKKIVFASKNRGKIEEVKAMFAGLDLVFSSLLDYEDVPEIIEDGGTFLDNALKKAMIVSEFTHKIALADDSGLEVDCLGGRPGVFSSRYAGVEATDEDRIAKLLSELKDIPPESRTAAFRCVLVLYFPEGKFESFAGVWQGVIYDKPMGNRGFGYDPVFFLPDAGRTVAQLAPEEKNALSHRAKAFNEFKNYLQKNKF